MNVKTRNGLFANEGYGGGVFNGNTAFGGLGDMDARPVMGGLGVDNDPAYPWMKYSMQTHALQQEINEDFNASYRAVNPCPIDVDGFLGGTTCGALAWLGREAPSTCYNYSAFNQSPKVGNCPAKITEPRDGDPCASKNTIRFVQRYIGQNPDGTWGPSSQTALNTETHSSGKTYCDIVGPCSGPLPTGVVCQTDAPDMSAQPVPTQPAPQPRPQPAPEPEPEPEEPQHKESSMGAILVGGLLLAGVAAIFIKNRKK